MSAGVSALRGPAPALRSAAPDERRPVRALRPTGPQLPFALRPRRDLPRARDVRRAALDGDARADRRRRAPGTRSAPARWRWAGCSGPPGSPPRAALARRRRRHRGHRSRSPSSPPAPPTSCCGPTSWDALAAGIARGIDALPGARVPYRGIDEWTRLVIPLGGTVLTVVAALAAFWPRRGRTGFPLVALILLVTLYAVPAVALDFEGEFLRGALLALLVLAFLRLERLRLTEARGGRPARGRDRDRGADRRPARSTATRRGGTTRRGRSRPPPRTRPASPGTTTTGRSTGRATAARCCASRRSRPAYWKAESLDVFDGRRWREARSGHARVDRLRSCPPTRPRATAGRSASRSACATCARARS